MNVIGWCMLKNLSLVFRQNNLQMSLLSKMANYECYLSICIERHPIITCQANNLEDNLCSTLFEIENEKSNKSNYELEKDADLKKISLVNKGNLEFNYCNSYKLPVHDLEAYSQNELKNFKVSSRLSDVNLDKIMNFSNRRLQESLFFVTKQQIGSNKESWVLPKDVILRGETIKQAAERILNYNCGDKFNVLLYGNTPIGCTKYSNIDYNKKQNNVRGYKIFYLLARYISGHIHSNRIHQWLNVNEIQEILPKSVYVEISHVFHISQ